MSFAPTTATRQEVEEFLIREAWLLDNYRLRDWQALLTDDIRYWIPTIEYVYGEMAPYREDVPYVPYIDYDQILVETKIVQLETGLQHSETPVSVTQRMVTNILVDPSERADEVKVFSNVQVTQVRHGDVETCWRARREDRLRNVDGRWKLAERKAILLTSVLPRSLGILL